MTPEIAEQGSTQETSLHANSRVSLEEVRHVASLANLDLTPEELPGMAHDLDAVLGYIAQLDELDTRSIAPMTQISDAFALAHQGAAPAAGHGQSLRRDTLKPSVDRSAVMAEAPETDGRFFKVPKVIER